MVVMNDVYFFFVFVGGLLEWFGFVCGMFGLGVFIEVEIWVMLKIELGLFLVIILVLLGFGKVDFLDGW